MTDNSLATDEQIAAWENETHVMPSDLYTFILSLIARIRAETAKNSGEAVAHLPAWRRALVIAKEHAEVSPPDIDDKAYWQHEIDALDKIASDLATPANSRAELARSVSIMDATPEMVKAALAVDWSNENEEATVHNIWHAMISVAVADREPIGGPDNSDDGDCVSANPPMGSACPMSDPVLMHDEEDPMEAMKVELQYVQQEQEGVAGKYNYLYDSPSPPQITEEMVDRAASAYFGAQWGNFGSHRRKIRNRIRAALTASLAIPANSRAEAIGAEAISDVLKTLEWMDRKGGLGLDVHHKIGISIRSLRALLQKEGE